MWIDTPPSTQPPVKIPHGDVLEDYTYSRSKIDKVNWITADSYGKLKVAFIHV